MTREVDGRELRRSEEQRRPGRSEVHSYINLTDLTRFPSDGDVWLRPASPWA